MGGIPKDKLNRLFQQLPSKCTRLYGISSPKSNEKSLG
jgi:hypothetical protein